MTSVGANERPRDEELRVSMLELFFDLVTTIAVEARWRRARVAVAATR